MSASKYGVCKNGEGRYMGTTVTKKHPQCKVCVDATTFNCDAVDLDALKNHPTFVFVHEGPVKRKKLDQVPSFAWVAHFKRKRGSKFRVYSQPQLEDLTAFRILFRQEGRAELRQEEIRLVLEATRKPVIAGMKVVFHFGTVESGIDADYIRRHGDFGECRPRSIPKEVNEDEWECQRGAVLIRSYLKEIGVHRLELRLNGRFLNEHRITNIFKFKTLVRLLPKRHLRFVELNDEKLIWHLRRVGRRAAHVLQIMQTIVALEGNLYEWLAYLRKEVGLTDANRFLEPSEANTLVRNALRRWAAKWPATPLALRKGK